MAVYSLDQVLEILIRWEQDLSNYYLILEDHLVNDSSKSVVKMLKKEQAKIMAVLDAIDVSEYKNVEFDKNLPNFEGEELVRTYSVDELSGPQEIIDKVFDFEERLLEIYQYLANIVVYEKSQDLFNMLKQFKLGQAKKIKSLMDSYSF